MKETSEDRVAAVKSRQTKVVFMFSVMLNSEQSEVVLQDDNPARESCNDLMFREYRLYRLHRVGNDVCHDPEQ